MSSDAHTAYGVTRVVWSPDDRWLAYVRASDEQVVCVEAESGRELFTWNPPRFWGGVFIAALSDESLLVVTRGADDVRVFAVVVPDGGVLAESRFDAAPGDIVVAASADGSTAAVLSGLTHDTKDRGHELTWLDTRSLTVVGRERVTAIRGDRLRRMALHPDGLWAAWVNPQQAQRYEERREVERVDRGGASRSGPVFTGSGDLQVLRWVDVDRLLVAVEPATVTGPNAGWTRVLLTDPERSRVVFDGEREAARVGTALVFSEVDVHPADGRLLLSWTNRLTDPGEASTGTATVLRRDGEVTVGWQTETAFTGAYGALWADEGDGVVELVGLTDEEVVLQRRDEPGTEAKRQRVVRLERPAGTAGWGATGRVLAASLATSPRRTWAAITWAVGRYARDEQLTWVPLVG